jgi:mannitol-1-/sugar-/sorbitol-6-phosphatase
MDAMSRFDATAAGFLFDMDGTLVDSTAIVERTWGGFADEHGIDVAEILAVSHGRQAIDTVGRFLPDRDPAEHVAIADALVASETASVDGVVEIPGAAALIGALLDAGAPVALVTSAPRELAIGRMRAAGVPLPAVLVTSEDVPRGKPAPDAYLLGAERLGVPAADCLAFEDADAGLEAAIAAGCRTVVVGPLESATAAGLERLVDHRGLRLALVGGGADGDASSRWRISR